VPRDLRKLVPVCISVIVCYFVYYIDSALFSDPHNKRHKPGDSSPNSDEPGDGYEARYEVSLLDDDVSE